MTIKKIILYLIGFITLFFGIIGFFLPILPTTPFILISLSCFSSCNQKIHNKVRNMKYISEYIDNYENKSGILPSTKIKILVFLWCGLFISIIITLNLFLTIILLLIGIAITCHIVLLKTKKLAK